MGMIAKKKKKPFSFSFSSKIDPNGFTLSLYGISNKQRVQFMHVSVVIATSHNFPESLTSVHALPISQESKDVENQSSGRGDGLGPLQRVLLLDTPGLTVWRRLLPAPCAAQSLRAVLAVQRRRRAHRHIHTVDRDQLWCSWLPVALGLLVRWRERVWPAENIYTPLGWKRFINVPFRKCALLYLQCWRMIFILMLFNICLSIISIQITIFMSLHHL